MIVYRTINGIEFGVNISKGASLLCAPEIASIIDGDVYEFVEYLYDTKKAYTPMIATWEITNCCNFACPFCYINTPGKPNICVQTFSKMKSYIDDLVDAGLLIVYLTGGEILSVPDFEEIYRYLKRKGVFVVLLTNLSLLENKHLELFREYPPLRITASIYGMTETQFTSVTGQPYNLCHKILSNILKLQEMNINVTCQMPVNRHTVADLLDIADWCYTHNIRFTFNNELTDSYYNESRNEEFIPDNEFSELKSKIKQVEAPKSTKKVAIQRHFGYKYHFDCISGKHTYAISFDGHLRPCFNIWESDCQFFDGSVSMKKAMTEMQVYIENMKNIVIEGCHGCDAFQICSECIYTRLKHKAHLQKYINEKCAENQKRICELCL